MTELGDFSQIFEPNKIFSFLLGEVLTWSQLFILKMYWGKKLEIWGEKSKICFILL